MYSLDPPDFTPAWVRTKIRSGETVDLEAPGWKDTRAAICPVCARGVHTFHVEPSLLFQYGAESCYKHVCHQPEPQHLNSRLRWAQIQQDAEAEGLAVNDLGNTGNRHER